MLGIKRFKVNKKYESEFKKAELYGDSLKYEKKNMFYESIKRQGHVFLCRIIVG